MGMTPGSHKNSRHLPAFILLFLAEQPASGAELMEQMEAAMPHFLADSAGVYRALQALEKSGALETTWEPRSAGTPRKIYRTTAKGRAALQDFADEIRMRQENFRFFLERLGRGGQA